jgi:hypothetical protein
MRGALHVFSAHQDAAVRIRLSANWPIDLDTEIDCWRGQRRVRMLGCRWEGGYLVCETRVSTGPVEPVRGLICVRRDALEILPNDRPRRIAILERKFGRYICWLRPRSRFVFELRRVWPLRLTVNWPF